MKRKKEGNRKHVKKYDGNKSGDFVDQEEMETLLSGKKMTFSDDDDEDDIDIDIRDEEDEMSGNIGEDEVKNFIRKLGLDQFDSHQSVVEEDGEEQSDLETKKAKASPKLDKKSRNKSKKEENPTRKETKKQDSVHVRFDAEEKTSEQSLGKQKKKKNQRKSASDIPVQHDEVSSSSHASSQLLIQLQGKWFEEMLSSRDVPSELPDETVISTYQIRAKELYEKEVGIYEKEQVKEDESHSQWMKTVVSSGVMADKIAALGLQIQQAPVHTSQYLDQLLSLAKKKGRREAGVAVDALRHLFLEELLPNDRKLRRFEKHDFDQLDSLSKTKREQQLILWYFENQLKTKYETFVSLQQTLSYDTVVAVKAKAISTMYELLVNKPELEQKLLLQLVNKLGDPDYKVASKVVHWLKNLVKVHSQMKGVVVTEVEQLLYRPNISSKTQYYCVCFLNQLLLSSRESSLAAKLIIIYFKFFNLCMRNKKDTSDKILNALLTGVNRAYPYSKVDDAKVNEQMDLLFKVIHQTTFNTGLQAMMLLKQVLAARHTMNDRFYSALYRKLLDPGLAKSSHQAMFLNLIYQATKDDVDVKRIMAFIKRILQICHGQLPPFICGALFMVSEVIKKQPKLLFTKQLPDESDDEEHFEDVKEEGDENNATMKGDTSDDKQEKSKTHGWIHKPSIKIDQSKGYDALARNPSFSGAERSVLWELKKLANHYHPSVCQFAMTILSGESISYSGNPLDDFTLMRFLDRFVYKNPKTKTENSDKASAPFERKTLPSSGIGNVKSSDFLTLPKEDVPLDVKFFHQYFSQKEEIENKRKEQEKENKKKRKAERGEDDSGSLSDEDSDASSVGDDEFEEIMEEEMERLMEESDDDSLSVDEDETDDEEDEEELGEDLDFARDLSTKKKSKSEDSENSEDDMSDFDDGDDEDDDDDDDDADAFDVKNDDEFDEEGFGESDDDDDGPPEPKIRKKMNIKTKTKKIAEKKKGKKKKQSDEDAELQENAEKFSSMIDENVSSKFDTMTMEALSNRDKAKWKQLEWEVNRDKWIRGRDTKTIIEAKKTKKRHRWFSKKRKPGKNGGKKK